VAGMAPNLVVYALAQGVMIGGLGASAAFGPLMADASLWVPRRRGIAVSLARGGELPGRRGLAADPHLADRGPWLARGACGGGRDLPGAHAAPGADAARPGAGAARRRGADRRWAPGAAARPLAQRADGGALRRRGGLLHRHGDAAGPHRRLLRRPRLRRGAGSGDALPHARLRHRLAHRLGPDRGPHRRARSAAAGFGCCRVWRWRCSCSSTGSPRSSCSPPCSGCSRAASCPPMR
jgi:hypothetical protein